jgi:hypothetical protein
MQFVVNGFRFGNVVSHPQKPLYSTSQEMPSPELGGAPARLALET